MQFNETQILLSILSVVAIMLMLVTIVIFILVRNYRLRIKQERERAQMISSIQEAERETIFRNLHDDVGPHLSAVKLKIESLAKSKDAESFARDISLVNESIVQSLFVVKSLIRNVRPVKLNDGINKSLEQLKDFIETNSKIKVELFIEGFDRSVPEETLLHLFRTVLEMMNNSLLHSQAKNITLTLSKSNDEILLQYQDNGVGFDEKKMEGGMGLKNIRYRLQLIRGNLEFHSSPGNGVTYKSVISL